jgi:hypothetical protein
VTTTALLAALYLPYVAPLSVGINKIVHVLVCRAQFLCQDASLIRGDTSRNIQLADLAPLPDLSEHKTGDTVQGIHVLIEKEKTQVNALASMQAACCYHNSTFHCAPTSLMVVDTECHALCDRLARRRARGLPGMSTPCSALSGQSPSF